MNDHARKYMDALRTFERSARAWMAEQFARIRMSQQDRFVHDCQRDTGHHPSCSTFDPEGSLECDCGLEIGLSSDGPRQAPYP